MLYCPKCGRQIGKAVNFCRACGFDLKAEETQVERKKTESSKEVIPERVEQVKPVDVSLKDLKCVNHPERDTVGTCSNCSKGVCIYCRTIIEGKGYCPSCAEKIASQSATVGSRTKKYGESQVKNRPEKAPMGWNWGAFFLTWLWGIFNSVWISLIALVPVIWIVMPFILGAYGSQWAWEKQRWETEEHFKRVQKQWAWAGLIVFLLVILLNLAVLLLSQ